MKIQFLNLTKVTQDLNQHPLHHMTNAFAKVDVATFNC